MASLRSIRLIPTLLLVVGCLVPGFQPECRSEASSCSCITVQRTPEGELETEMLMLINQYRILQGLQALAPDEALAKIAREHSLEMARQGFISHELPSGDIKARMNRGGYDYEIARENIAAARSVANAQSAFIDSPPHKRNLLAGDVERIGIGIVRCPPPHEKQLYITQIFVSPRQQYQPAVVQEMVLSRVDDLRKNGAGPLVPDAALERLASDSVASLNIPVKKEELKNLAANSAGELLRNGRTEIARVDVSVQLLHNLQNVDIPNRARIGQKARVFGTAVRQVVDEGNRTAYFVLTLIGFTN